MSVNDLVSVYVWVWGRKWKNKATQSLNIDALDSGAPHILPRPKTASKTENINLSDFSLYSRLSDTDIV